jgi:uncharacterized caspase-like protein
VSGSHSALIVASYDYTDPGLRRLHGAAPDAESLARVLQNPDVGGYDVVTMLNKPASLINLAVEDFFANRRPDDLLLVYISCYAVRDESGELYFAAADTRLSRLAATAVSAHFVNQSMSRSRSRRIVLLLDFLRGAVGEWGMAPKVDKTVRIGEEFRGRGRAVITAFNTLEYAFERDEPADTGAPSVFSRALVEGLESGEADRDQDGLVGLDDLYDYIYHRVHEVTPSQTPGMWAFEIPGEFYIARRTRSISMPATPPANVEAKEPTLSVATEPARDAARERARRAADRDAELARRQYNQKLRYQQPSTSRGGGRRLRLPRLPRRRSRTVPEPTGDLVWGGQPEPKDGVSFTAGYPGVVEPQVWYSLSVYVHLSRLQAQVDQLIAEESRRFGQRPTSSRAPAIVSLPKGTRLRIRPEVPGVEFNPPSQEVRWLEDLHQVGFRLQGLSHAAGRTALGAVEVHAKELLVAQVPLSIHVRGADERHEHDEGLSRSRASLFKSVFVSYAHQDEHFVRAFAATYRALGVVVFVDKASLGPGEPWEQGLARLIEEADLFQLFWSEAASRSRQVAEEWQHALLLQGRKGEWFIRPVYWNIPWPPPPQQLKHLHFAPFDPAVLSPVMDRP